MTSATLKKKSLVQESPARGKSRKVSDKLRDSLRERILESCDLFSRSSLSSDKEYLRGLHLNAKRQTKGYDQHAMQKLFVKHRAHFKNGNEIDPSKIRPTIRLVDNPRSTDGELFRLVRGMWSMPSNKGYGRRLRFIVFDDYHKSVIGIIGLQSPPADLGCRDELFAYPDGKKLDLVNSTMDAYTVGAVPPYTYLLGGKLCAGLISSDAVRQAYWRQYAGSKTLMNGRMVKQPLVAVTTTGAFGRSSMYNRLTFNKRLLAEPIGYTLGFGTLHIEHMYDDLIDFLRVAGLYKDGGFGSGPKIRWQNFTNALTALELPGSLLKHGVCREVFLYRFVEQLEGGMNGGQFGAPLSMTVEEYGEFWKQRWALPRAARFPDWKVGDARAFLHSAL